MTPNDFIETKAPQLAYYGKAFLNNQLEHSEIKLYMWDVLEEWQSIADSPTFEPQTPTDTEKVFWHLLHCFDQWPAIVIRGNQFLRQQVDDCCDYINIGGTMPSGCIGLRPTN
ncbi:MULTISPECIES: hypothetical protein [Shewanella]|uniref:Uncharacterized protein n=1 Tax=Shewanella japonica TaxID=93973 RepID=A0ABM6JGZ0_9GAMM|nr:MULTISPECIES: hypothetical protein [Shewanella]ARD21402.1 hypothetical protein SJ2017_1071 [Shewanella japonica]KPZ71170.1 hypothetical protein AN944_01912 [Shewanella sp. P1-14-1]MBQ4888798.1 hypothetical protein [Shewanella sp. MMG014]OBT08877.1 hypothetical protein A9267_07520 [Shewanella sp. UCD-FRSSP16_17]